MDDYQELENVKNNETARIIEIQQNRKLKKYFKITLLLLLFIVLLTILMSTNFIGKFSSPILSNLVDSMILVTGFMVILTTLGIRSLSYLSGEKNTQRNNSNNRELRQINKLKDEVLKLRNKVDGLSNLDQKEIIEDVKLRLKDESIESYLNSVKEKFLENQYRYDIYSSTKKSLYRAQTQLSESNRRANLNLILGMLFAVFGIGILVYFIINGSFYTKSDSYDLAKFTIDFLPRISIIILIEVFAYFFLRLYKVSLNDAKYFQNESTNLESKFLALQISLQRDDKELIDLCITDLLAVERNPIFENSKTTREAVQYASNPDQFVFSTEQLTKVLEVFRREQTK